MNATVTAVSAKYETDRAVVRLVGTVSVESILALCDEVDLAVEYYQYPAVELQLASPGGDVTALDHYLARLKQWRSPPVVRIETLGLTEAASAAAIILSLGDIGARSAYTSTRLLYHDPRAMIPENTVATRASLGQLSAALADADRRMLDLIVEHIWTGLLVGMQPPVEMRLPDAQSAVAISKPDDLRSVLSSLNVRDQPISADAAKALYLIDTVIS